MAKKIKKRGEATEFKMAKTIDQLSQFEEFQNEILPFLKKALKEGATAEDIYARAQALAAARTVSIAATEQDSTKAMAAIRDILDRTQGKAKERTEVEHKYSKLKDEELDALLLSEAATLDEDEAQSH